ncbi:hypothetical protein JCM10908_003415 [Rhodotorula pacifica]|uniref:uncharacterized protein n=1 Tax=Rhodotorula pacifica TaxID=1495444 RepID=UPI00317A3DDE
MEGTQLESRVDAWEKEHALAVAIAAKAATLHVLAGRFSESLSLEPDDLVPPETHANHGQDQSAPTAAASRATRVEAQKTLDAATARLASLRRETAQEAATWLSRVCTHVGVQLDQLPDALDPETWIPLPTLRTEEREAEKEANRPQLTKEQREWDTTWELVLVSLGLVGTAAPTAKDEHDASGINGGPQGQNGGEKNLASKFGSKVGSLFFSSSASATPDSSGSSGTGAAKSSSSNSSPPPLNYTALSRSLVVRTLTILSIPHSLLTDIEHTIAQFLFFQLQERNSKSDAQQEADRAKDEVEWDSAAREYRDRAAKKGNALKWAATGAGFVLGGVAIGLTGGLAAPAIAAGLGTFGIATFSGASGAVLIGTLLGLGGGGLAGYRTHRRMKGLEDVRFEPIQDDDAHELPQIPSLTATIVASGFLLDPEDSVEPWRSYVRSSRSDAYALKADPQTFLDAGRSLDKFVQNRLITMGGVEVVKRTALAAVYAGVALPLTIFQTATTAFDSDFTRCREKAQKAGVLLAGILEKEVQGKRPVVLIGYGPGASLILACLEHLHSLGLSSLVYSAVLVSLPSSPSRATWARARSVVAHELINVWSGNDWVLGIAARLYTLSPSIAGIRPVKGVEGVSNIDVSDLVTRGHLEIRQKLGLILERVMEKREEQPTTPASAETPPPPPPRAVSPEEAEKLAEKVEALDVKADA